MMSETSITSQFSIRRCHAGSGNIWGHLSSVLLLCWAPVVSTLFCAYAAGWRTRPPTCSGASPGRWAGHPQPAAAAGVVLGSNQRGPALIKMCPAHCAKNVQPIIQVMEMLQSHERLVTFHAM